MAKITIEIDLGNAAFDEEPMSETARILRELATRIEDRGAPIDVKLYDINGNRVGFARHSERGSVKGI